MTVNAGLLKRKMNESLIVWRWTVSEEWSGSPEDTGYRRTL